MSKLSVKIVVILCILLASSISYSQLTLNDIYTSEKYSSKQLSQITLLNKKPLFALIENITGNQNIVFYNSQNVNVSKWKIRTAESSDSTANWNNLKFSPSDTYFIVGKRCERPYRNSVSCSYYIGKENEDAIPLSSGIQFSPDFSPNEKYIAFVKYNNLYIKDIQRNSEKAITTDGAWNKIINGKSDWVYEEEFSFTQAFSWNAKSDKIAYLKFDESEVKEFSFQVNYDAAYPSYYQYKYPKVGEKNAKVTLWYYDVKSEKNKQIKLPFDYEFIPAVYWNATGDEIVVALMNRFQDTLRYVSYEIKTGKFKTIYFETDKAYVSLPQTIFFLSDNSFFITSEKDGYNHIYHYDKEGKLIRQITKGNFEVKEIYGVDEKNQVVYYNSNERRIVETVVAAVNYNTLDSRILSNKNGVNSAQFSSDFSFFINTYSNASQPKEYSIRTTKGEFNTIIEENKVLKEKIRELPQKEFLEIPIDSIMLQAWIIKPNTIDSTKKYPLLMFVYGGPGVQQVLNEWSGSEDLFFRYLVQQDFIVVCVDNRGTDGRGSAFRKSSYLNLGKIEIADQIAAANYLSKLNYIDSSKIAIYGWSYGGFLAALALQEGNAIFKAAIAAAPVTSWKLYNNVYTERYMKTPQLNPEGYKKYNPISGVKKQNGKLMLIHGMEDDNVHFQHTVQYINAMNEAQKDYRLYLYPNSAHGIYGKQNRLDVYLKIVEFLRETLR